VGFATDISVNRGETVHFKIKTDVLHYRLDLYRLGFYGGSGARYMATVRPSSGPSTQQPDCLADSATGLIDCGNWTESIAWRVPSEAGVEISTDHGATWHPAEGRERWQFTWKPCCAGQMTVQSRAVDEVM
jgi:hypothetical protein